jgi:hypothetical protein
MPEKDVVIQLTHAQALVLFECLARLESSDSPPWEEPAEERVFWYMQAQLESILAEPFQPNYNELLAEARQIVRGDER